MKCLTWRPGTNKELDDLFDHYREIQASNQDHKLAKNYTRDFYNFSIAFTIAFSDEDEPEICSSIASRDCWPKGAYRILNRLWKTPNYRIKHSTFISQAMASNASSQIAWLKENTDCKLYFISRESSNWLKWTADKFRVQYKIDFEIGPNKYLTCPNEAHDSCWQSILYNGDSTLLNYWKSK